MNITILQSKLLTGDIIGDLNGLLREFRTDSDSTNMRRWRVILAQKNIQVFVARDGKKIIGMAILRWHLLPIGTVGTVEDVIVDPVYRGRGYGAELTRAIIGFARKKKMAYIDLTSRPERKAANKLYQKFGWKKRETNLYRLII